MDTGPKWYITRGEQRIGPIDASQLKHMAMTEQLAPTEYVWKEGMDQWVQARQVQGLFDGPPVTVPLDDGAPAPMPEADAATPVAATQVAPTSPEVKQAETPSAQAGKPAPVTTTQQRPVRTRMPRLSAAPSRTSDVLVPMLGGLMLLTTVFVPWGYAEEYAFGPKKLLFSWTIVKSHFTGDNGQIITALWLIASWVAGLLAVALTPMTRGLSRASVCLVFGGVAAILFIVFGFQGGLDSATYKSGNHSLELTLSIISGIILFFILMIVHIVRRTGGGAAMRIMQIILCIALIITTSILLYSALSATNSLWSQFAPRRIKAPWSAMLRSSLLIDAIGTLLGCALLLIHAFTGRQRGFLSFMGLALLYLSILAFQVLDLIGEAGATNNWNEVSAGVNGILLLLGTALVLGSGIVQMAAQLRGTK